jgi:hypothetical protein
MLTRAARQAQAERDQRQTERHERIGRQALTKGRPGATMGRAVLKAVPKTVAYRDPALLAMAQDRPCLLCPAGTCTCTPGSTVACHSNFAEHGGKGKNRRADDCYSVWGGMEAHRRLDQPIGAGGPTKAQKEATFMAAHARQVLAWRQVAADPAEPERFRRAARRALEHLNATPIPEA